MKNIIVSLVISLVFLAGGIFAQDKKVGVNIDFVNTIEVGKIVPDLRGYFTYKGRSSTGGYCWMLITPTYKEFHCGPTFDLSKWAMKKFKVGLVVSGGFGFQTGAKKPALVAASAFAYRGKFNNLYLIEKGVGTLWQRDQFSFQATKNLKLCVAYQSFQGVGPCIEYKVSKNFALKVEANFDRNKPPTFKFGISFRR